jgi:outer membrane cobalamin receptor
MGVRCLYLVVMPTVALSCATTHSRSAAPVGPVDRMLITEEMIARSGSATAWDVLKKLAPQLHYGETKDHQPSRLERRGQSSFILSDAPLVFLDGVRLPDFRNLERIAAETISTIEIFNGLDATTYYGSNAVGGAIVIKTKNGAS